MDNQNQNNDESTKPTTASSLRDGLINFSTYSTAQLNYLQYSINRATHPQDFRNLVEELARRGSRSTDITADDREYCVQFTSSGGVLGWIHATYRRLSLYGSGALRFETDDLVLRGWQRTWLGVPLQAEIRIDSRHIRNVVREDQWVKFESHPDGARRRRFQCEAANQEAAASIVDQLPKTRTEGFDTAWTQLRAFDQAIQLGTPRAWATPVLIGLNILVFLALVFAGAGFWIADLQVLTRWGSNFGLLTIDGQLWRLFTAPFLHAGVVHLALNMWALWGVGRLVERLYGTWVFLFLYVCAGITASLSSIAWDPFKNSVGASGAIFGILGACLAFLVRRDTRVPAKIVRAQGLSTLAFILFNLINGMTSTNIDNAAHVGGLISGCLLGWILARPLNPETRARLAGTQIAGAGIVVWVAFSAGFWQIYALRSSQSAPERYWTSHQWLLTGQVHALRVAAEIQTRANAGSISSAEFVERFERDVLAFWRDADTRLLDEPESKDPELQQFAALAADYVRLRHEAVLAALDAMNNNDQARFVDSRDYAQFAEQRLARIKRLEMRAQADRLHSLSESRYPKAIRNVFSRLQWECVTPPEVTLQPDAESSVNDGREARVAGGCAAQRAFETGDYESLDRMLHPVANNLADLDDGNSRLSGVVGGFQDLFERQRTLDSAFSHLADWRRARPGSDGPDLVETMLFRTWAWSVRGSGFAKSVSPQEWAVFGQRIEMAAAALQDAEGRPAPSPLWYQLALQVGLDQSRQINELRSIFDAGIARFPEYYQLYSDLLRALMPRWNGSYAQTDNFIQEMVRRTHASRGPEMYARLYSSFAAMEGDDTDLFKDAYAKWPSMKQGYEDMLKRYPKSESIRNSYAAFACRAKDAQTYRAARAAMQTHIIKTAWTQKFSPQKCDESLL